MTFLPSRVALGAADDGGDVADGQAAAHEREQDLDAGGVGEGLEQVGHVEQQLLVGHFREQAGRGLAVTAAGAGLQRCAGAFHDFAGFFLYGCRFAHLSSLQTIKHMSNCS